MADLGTDLSCVDDLTSTMSTVSGRRCLAEAIARRLMTPRGRLIDDPNYGFDLTGELNDDLAPEDIARIGSSVEAECLKDERVLAADVAVQFIGGALIVAIVLTDGDGPFNLVLSATAVTVSIITVGA